MNFHTKHYWTCMDIHTNQFWEEHYLLSRGHETALSKFEKSIIKAASGLPPTCSHNIVQAKRNHKVRARGRMFHIGGAGPTLTPDELSCYSDDDEYDDDDVKKSHNIGPQIAVRDRHFAIAPLGNEHDDRGILDAPGRNGMLHYDDEDDDDDSDDDDTDDEDANADDDTDDEDANANADDDTDAADDAGADDGEDAVDEEDADDEEDAVDIDPNFDFWAFVSRFTERNTILDDASVSRLVHALPAASQGAFKQTYNEYYQRALDILNNDNFSEKTTLPLRGIINYMIYMGNDTYETLSGDLDFLHMAVSGDAAFFPQVRF